MVGREVDGQHAFSLHVFFYVFDCRRSRGRDRRRAGRSVLSRLSRSGLSRRGSRFVLSRFGCRGRRGSRFVLSRLGCRGRRSGLSPVLDRLSREPETWPKLERGKAIPQAVLGHSWSFLRRSWPFLGWSWPLLGRSWPVLGRS